jgi:S1-C subfamily serine protease
MPQAMRWVLTSVLIAAAWAVGPLPAQDSAPRAPGGLQVLTAAERLFIDVIAEAEKSIVAVMRVRRPEGGEIPMLQPDFFNRQRGLFPRADAELLPDADFIPTEFGTGIVIDAKGLILTNYHVVRADSQHFVTTHERKTYRAKIKAADRRSDLAVLELEPLPPQAIKLTPIKFGDASTLRKGQIVIALGNPYGIAKDGQVSASWGIVSNLARKAAPDPDETTPNGRKRSLYHYGTLIQTDAKLNFGTSGGALMNLKGEMVGLTTSLAATAGYEQAAGYAIPVDETFLRIVEALKQGREVEYGFLGIRLGNLDIREVASGKQGMRVDGVVPGTPAYRYGLQPHDIITHVNGKPIYDADGLVLHVSSLPIESPARLTVLRGGQVRHFELELAKAAPEKYIATSPRESWRGLQIDFASALGAEFLHRNDALLVEGSLAVVDVAEDSPAWRAGLRPDMIISHVGTTRVQSPKEFREAVASKPGTVPLREVRFRDGQIERPAPTHIVDPQ